VSQVSQRHTRLHMLHSLFKVFQQHWTDLETKHLPKYLCMYY
jgi:hypothetical protein